MKQTPKSLLLLYFISYIVFSFGITNFTPFLSEMGYNPFERGIILSSLAVATMTFQLLFGYLSDKYQTIKKIVIISLIIYIIISLFLFDKMITIFIGQLIIISIVGGLNNGLSGLFDNWIMGINDKTNKLLSFIKGFGSFGWAVGSVVSSFIITQFGYGDLKWTILILSIILIILVVKKIPDIKMIEQQKLINKSDISNLLKRADYNLLIISLLLMYSLVIANTNIVIDKMIYLDSTDVQISIKWFISSIVEIPAYLLLSGILKKVKAIRLLQFSSLILTIQFILFALSNTSTAIILISLLQIFTTPIIMVASKILILQITPQRLMNSSQLIALGIFTGVPSLLVPSITGYLTITIGYNFTLLLLAGIGLISFVVTLPLIWQLNKIEYVN